MRYKCTLTDPQIFTQNAVDQVLKVIESDKSKISSQFSLVKNDIQHVLIPFIGIRVMSQFVVPPKLWAAATESEQSAFNQSFLEFIINLYSSPLKSFSNQTIQVYPSRSSWQTQQRVQINSIIHNPDAGSSNADIPVSFILQKNDCSWQFIDFVVDNISALANIQSQIQSILHNIDNPKLSDLTDVIKKHNASSAT
ncbi:MAG: ABC transporter substrate-binding protein [Gammaproteobacteria bacterium]|nr:ABC transporter substrate-binding protein [Gammaproteobacteria bacterium]